MLTPRGWGIGLCIVLMLAAALLDSYVFAFVHLTVLGRSSNVSLGLLGLTLGLWFCWEWFIFVVRSHLLIRRLQAVRVLADEHGPVDTLWSLRSYRVHVELSSSTGLSFPYLRVADLVPHGVDLQEGETALEGSLAGGDSLAIDYRLRCPVIGAIRFEGLRLRMADLQGFFSHTTFVRDVVEYRVLPALVDAKGHSPSVKRHNLLPPPGVHRLRRSGSGSELLDLRDYLPGDPPKTIAWKASARRDRLITKEFESQVPVRCTLFLDTSASVRVGQPGPSALTQAAEIAAAVVQVATGARDLTGLCLFDDSSSTYVRPARGNRHLVHLLDMLAGAVGTAPCAKAGDAATVLAEAYRLAQEVYPDALRPNLNSMPAWLPWLRPTAAYTLRNPKTLDCAYARLPWLMLLLSLLFLSMIVGNIIWLGKTDFTSPRSITSWLLLCLVFVAIYGLGAMLLRLPTVSFLEQRLAYRHRKRLAALLSVQYGLAPGGLSLLMEDEDRFVLLGQRFLSDHRVPFTLPTTDEHGRPLFTSPAKVEELARALVRAVRLGHDNELFVLLVDLLPVAEAIEPLVQAVRVAVARHHRLLVICPWPTDVPVPEASDTPNGLRAITLPTTSSNEAGIPSIFAQIRRQFARLGVSMVVAHRDDSVRLILDRLHRLRMVGGKR